MNFCKPLCVSLFLVLFLVGFAGQSFSQGRTRVVESQPVGYPAPAPIRRTSAESLPRRIPPLTNQIIVQPTQSLIKKTGSSRPVNAIPSIYVSRPTYAPDFNNRLLSAIESKYGIPYRYGSDGPYTYDCSGLVWSVFRDAGFDFERTSARTLWQNSEPVEGDDRFKFGTLVFFNKLGHIGIVADENGFYQASSSQGVTYSKFEGYWQKRIVGYRRLAVTK